MCKCALGLLPLSIVGSSLEELMLTCELTRLWAFPDGEVVQRRMVPFFAWSLLDSVSLPDIQPDAEGKAERYSRSRRSRFEVLKPASPQNAAAPSPCTAAAAAHRPGGRSRLWGRCSTA